MELAINNSRFQGRLKRVGRNIGDHGSMVTDRRTEPERKATQIQGWIKAAGFSRRCVLANVSRYGARLIVANTHNLPDTFLLLLSPTPQSYRQCVVKWRAAGMVGVEFSGKLSLSKLREPAEDDFALL
jgi:hypothetical protein